MVKKKTGIGIEALFEVVLPETAQNEPQPALRQDREMAVIDQTSGKRLELAPVALERLESVCQFVSWLIDETVSPKTVVEIAINIMAEEVEGQGKESRLVTEIMKRSDPETGA